MPKHERSRFIACICYFKSCLGNCEFKSFFPNDSEIDYSNFFNIVEGALSLRALLNDTVDERVKTDARKLTQIRSILIEEKYQSNVSSSKGCRHNIHAA